MQGGTCRCVTGTSLWWIGTSTIGRFVKNWATGVKQWWLWAIGDAPLPDNRSRAMLAATVVAVGLLVVGLAVGFREPSRTVGAEAKFATTPASQPSQSNVNTGAAATPLATGAIVSPAAPVGTVAPVPTTATSPPGTTATTSAASTHPFASSTRTARTNKSTGTSRPTAVAVPTTVSIALVPKAGPGWVTVSWQPATSTAVTGFGLTAASNEVSATPVTNFRPGGALAGPAVGMASDPQRSGYWLVNSGGQVSAHGGVPSYGSVTTRLVAPVIGIVATPDRNGYWLVASDGGIFTFGDAPFLGSNGGKVLSGPVVGITGAADGSGYWLVSGDGGVFTFGDAAFHGAAAGNALNAPVSVMALDQVTGGYWLVSQDGGIFAYGAPFYGPADPALL